MDAPLEEFDEQAMKEIAAQIIGDARRRRIAFHNSMALPGITFSEEQRAQIETLVEAGDTEGARQLILGLLNEAIGAGEQSSQGTLI